VQGRFEDIPFLDSADQTLRLIPAALDTSHSTAAFRRRRAAWAAEQRQACTALGLTRLLPAGDGVITASYPLHPVALMALPEMCSRFGQHGRTLFAFLTGREPSSVGEFLDGPLPRAGALPSVDLARLYDFFTGPGLSAAGGATSRLLEVDTVLREVTGLTEAEQRALKTVGLLNLLSQGGPLRAHLGLVAYALAEDTLDIAAAEATLSSLVARELVTYRGFADEYRLWQGSDLDLARIISDERDNLTRQSAAELLSNRDRMPPAIASRHTQRVGMIRYFATMFADTQSAALPPTEEGADGLLVHWIDDAAAATTSLRLNEADIGRRLPVVVATTGSTAPLREAVLELAAVELALERPDVNSDRVARRELQERAAEARRRVDELASHHLRPNAAGTTYLLAMPRPQSPAATLTPLPASRSLSSLLSDVCDTTYKSSPEVRNEMLGRRQLTSQAARARRDLLEAMVLNPTVHRHGLEGYGPEVAMYEALLSHTGLHRPVDPNNPAGPWWFDNPRAGSTFTQAWGKLRILLGQATHEPVSLDRAYIELQAPPIGLKEGPIPLLLAALLLQHEDTVAVYQDGSYQPRLGADTLERLVKSPDRFTIKTFDVDNDRAELLRCLGGLHATAYRQVHGTRNTTVLSVAAPLIAAAAALPAHTKKTGALSSDIIQVRQALLTTREPDQLLFTDLPQACGLDPFKPGDRGRQNDIELFGRRLDAALDELRNTYSQLLQNAAQLLARDFGVELTELNDLWRLRSRLRNTAGPLIDVDLIDRRLHAFVLAVLDDRGDDRAWLENVLSLVAGLPAASWQDLDQARFQSAALGLGEQLRRLVALYSAAAATTKHGFDTHRLTLTRADGQEHARVVWVEHRLQPDLYRVIDTAIAQAHQLLGDPGGEALLALLADRVLSQANETITPTAPATTSTASHRERQARARQPKTDRPARPRYLWREGQRCARGLHARQSPQHGVLLLRHRRRAPRNLRVPRPPRDRPGQAHHPP